MKTRPPVIPQSDPWLATNAPLSYNDVKSKLNWFYQIKDPVQRKNFASGQKYSRTITHVTFLAVAYIIVYFPAHIMELIHEVQLEVSPLYVVSSVFVLLLLLAVLLSGLGILIVSWEWRNRLLSDLKHRWRSYQPFFYGTLFTASCFYMTLLYFKRIIFPLCNAPESAFVHYSCDGGDSQAQYILYATYNLYMVLLLFFIHTTQLAIEHVWIIFFLEIGVGVIGITQLDSPLSVFLPFAFWTLCIYSVIVDVHLRNVMQYYASLREKHQADEFATELKFAIANVAHDLKTPLSSFTNGVDLLQLLWVDMDNAILTQNLDQVRAFGKQISDCLQTIKSTTTFMTMAINRCLDSTKASNNVKLVPKNEPMDLYSVLSLPLAVMNNVQSKISIKLDLDAIDGRVTSRIFSDQQWLQENLLCLLSNAVKFSFKGLVTLRVVLAQQQGALTVTNSPISVQQGKEDDVERELLLLLDKSHTTLSNPMEVPSQLVFEVEDEGLGVHSEVKEKLFRPFQPSHRVSGGLGLGLYSLAMRVDALQGRYGVSERRDGRPGSLFWFSIPYAPDVVGSHGSMIRSHEVKRSMDLSSSLEPTDSMADLRLAAPVNYPTTPIVEKSSPSHRTTILPALETPDPLSTPANQDKKRSREWASQLAKGLSILLVDDAPTIIKMMSAMFRRLGCRVTAAEDGQVALDAIGRAQGFDLVLMDLQMPVMDGLEATRRIRAHDQRSVRDSVVVGMSANSDSDTIAAAYASGVNRFVPKPFTLDTFIDILQDLLLEAGKDRVICILPDSPHAPA